MSAMRASMRLQAASGRRSLFNSRQSRRWDSSNMVPNGAAKQALRTCTAPLFALAENFSAATATKATPVQVIETSLGFGENLRLLRHLGLRFYSPDSKDEWWEAHFGPGESGQLHEGFLKTGKGKVADSEYIDTFDAGETQLSPEDAVEWCKRWADGKVFVAVGQNCWTMVNEFLEEHDGCFVNDSIKFKEEGVNQVTQALISAVEEQAQKEGREPEDVMQDLMQEPKRLLPVLFTAENVKQFMPEKMQSAVDKGLEMKDSLEEKLGMKVSTDQGVDEIKDQVGDIKEDVKKETSKK